MCLIVFDWQPGTECWLRLSANRDEVYRRPAATMHSWPEYPGLYAGKDLEQGGTWLGVTEEGRWAALTNVRAPGAGPEDPRSRGELVLSYLTSGQSPEDWLATVKAEQYAPFNLLIGDQTELWYLCNHPQITARRLEAGLYSLSNAQLDSPWPKAELAKQQLAQASPPYAGLLDRRQIWPDNELPQTGVPLLWERLLSAQFIIAPGYGTRCSTGIDARRGNMGLQEITWDETGTAVDEKTFNIVLLDR